MSHMQHLHNLPNYLFYILLPKPLAVFPLMKFSRGGSLPLSKVGSDHRSWQSKLALEHRSNLV